MWLVVFFIIKLCNILFPMSFDPVTFGICIEVSGSIKFVDYCT